MCKGLKRGRVTRFANKFITSDNMIDVGNEQELKDFLINWYVDNKCFSDDPDEVLDSAIEWVNGLSHEEMIKLYNGVDNTK